MSMKKPAHPGLVFSEEFLKPLSMTVTEAARKLGVSRKHLSNIINGNASITADMATRIGIISKTSPKVWLGMQNSYDLAQLDMSQYKKITSAAANLRLD